MRTKSGSKPRHSTLGHVFWKPVVPGIARDEHLVLILGTSVLRILSKYIVIRNKIENLNFQNKIEKKTS